MSASDHSVLVAGSGSIGRRHMRNLRELGVERIAACDPQPGRLEPMASELGVTPFADFEEALAKARPDLVFVCTPPVAHVPQSLSALRAGAHVFIEKPLSGSVAGVEELAAEAKLSGRMVQIGYNLRFHPGIKKLKEVVDSGTIGRVLWAGAQVGSYLPDWRPWQDYRQTYSARQDLGGGIILDASHELDYVTWLLGQPSELLCMAGKVSRLAVDVEDCATILLRFPSGAQADVHLDFVQRAYMRTCTLAGEEGSAAWDYMSNEVRTYDSRTKKWDNWKYEFEANDMYVAEVKDFLRCVESGKPTLVTLQQSIDVLKIALAAKSAAEKSVQLT
jgi:predicted dehydrogenase